MAKLKRRGLKRREASLKETAIEKPKIKIKLRRRKNGTIHIDENNIVCYVCGKKIEQEHAWIIKKAVIKDGRGKQKIEINRTAFPVPPLMVGYIEDIPIYRHRKKSCLPLSETYNKKLQDYVRPEFIRKSKTLEGLEKIACYNLEDSSEE